MSVTSSIGLISGIDHDNIIDQLMAIEERPKTLIKNRNTVLQSQQTALLEINAQLLSLRNAAKGFTSDRTFKSTLASTSNEGVLTVTSTTSALPGNYSFRVAQLVSTQQTITRGFADTSATPIGDGTLTFERAEARLDRSTLLSELNGGEGIRRGMIRITDRSGNSSLVDLSTAVTVDDVLNEINNSLNISVYAEVDGDGLKLTDMSGGTAGDLIVGNVGTSGTATSLGLVGSSATGELAGTQVNRIGEQTLLSALNDGNGIGVRSGNDMTITTAGGGSYSINLSEAVTVKDVIDAIETGTSGEVNVEVGSDGVSLELTDTTGGGAGFTVAAAGSSTAAADLGILGDDSDGDSIVGGGRLVSSINSKLLRYINGGSGITEMGTISVTNRAGATTNIDLSAASSVAEVLEAINSSGAGVTASLNRAGNGLTLTDGTGGTGDITIADVTGTAATDLALAGTFSDTDEVDSGNLQFQYITESTRIDALGISRGKFKIRDSSGVEATIDISQGNEVNVGDIISEINSRGLQVNARINDTGDGILLEDTGPGSTAIRVTEAGGSTASDLGLLGTASAPGEALDGSFERTVTFTSGEIDGTTALSALNEGDGINIDADDDDFEITTRDGTKFQVDLAGAATVDDVINAINAASGGAVTASVNTLSTGLSLTDNTTGTGDFSVEALNDSVAASDLGILKSSNTGKISGNSVVEVATLENLAQMINNANAGIDATIINDGSPGAPYRLSLSSEQSGTTGAFVFDDGGLGFNATTLSEAHDAVVFYGTDDPANSLVLTSKTNTLTDAIPGVEIQLHSTSDQPVQVTVSTDTEGITTAVSDFVEAFNTVAAAIEKHDSYDSETEQRGLLLGDATVARVQSQIYNAVIGANSEIGTQFKSLSQIGIKVSSGAKLSFDRAKFSEAYASDPEAVEALFTFKQTEEDDDGEDVIVAQGVGVEIAELLAYLTDSIDGPIQQRLDAMNSQIEANNDKMEALDISLQAKRDRLVLQFVNMEKALAQLQSQSSSLTQLASIAAQSKSSNSSNSSSN